jgi:hypothetical protein
VIFGGNPGREVPLRPVSDCLLVPVTQAELATVTSHHRLPLRLPGTDPSVFQLSVAGSGLRGRLECLPVTQEAAGSSPVAPDKFCRMT